MKVSFKMIRSIIAEELSILVEATRLSNDSLDDQIDGLLMSYEQSSSRDDSVEEVVFTSLSILLEAPEDEEEAEPDPEDPEDTGPSDEEIENMIKKLSQVGYDISMTVDNSKQTVSDASLELKPPLDIDGFVAKIGRLLKNYDNLLDIPTVIVNRSKNFLEQNYDAAVVEEFEDILEQQFDVSLEKSEPTPTPAAVGAGSYPGGGA